MGPSFLGRTGHSQKRIRPLGNIWGDYGRLLCPEGFESLLCGFLHFEDLEGVYRGVCWDSMFLFDKRLILEVLAMGNVLLAGIKMFLVGRNTCFHNLDSCAFDLRRGIVLSIEQDPKATLIEFMFTLRL